MNVMSPNQLFTDYLSHVITGKEILVLYTKIRL